MLYPSEINADNKKRGQTDCISLKQGPLPCRRNVYTVYTDLRVTDFQPTAARLIVKPTRLVKDELRTKEMTTSLFYIGNLMIIL